MLKVLIVKTSSMGDIVHACPALFDLVNNVEDVQCDWLVEESFVDIVKSHNNVNNIITVALRRWKKEIVLNHNKGEYKRFLSQLRKTKYDYIIDAQGILKSAVLAKIAKGYVHGCTFKTVREPAASLLYDYKYAVDTQTHAVTKIRELFAKIFSYDMPHGLPEYNLRNSDATLNIDLPDEYIVFLHGTSRENKCWKEAKWIELAKFFLKNNTKVLLPWGNEIEKQRAQNISDVCDNVVVLPKMNIAQVARVICYAKGIVGLDSGFTHLGAAYNMPMVSLYGPTDVKLIGAFGKNQQHCDLYTITPEDIYTKLQWLIDSKE